MNKTLSYLALNLAPKVGPVKARQLIQSCGSVEAIFTAPASKLTAINGIGPVIAENLTSPTLIELATKEWAECQTRQIKVIHQEDENFPEPLKHYPDAPILLYVWGELLPQDQHSIAVVGTRAVTTYGTQITKSIAYQLAHNGLTIISGLARGVDTIAHEAALAAEARTIAVLGSGLAQLYPPENLALCQKIANGHGAIVSEFPLNSPPDRQSFPIRNRIVASWAKSLLVTESPKRSGSLITANMAGERGKNVYAVPGPVNRPHSEGCHELIRQGATLITSANDILEDENWFPSSTPTPGTPQNEISKNKSPLLDLLTTPMSADEVAEHLNQPITETLAQLTELELEGAIDQDSGGLYFCC